MPNGRPSIYTQELANKICEGLAQGRSLRSICRDEGMPSEATVRGWAMDNYQGFYSQYARARDIGIDALAEETLEISDDGANDWMLVEDPKSPGYVLNGEHVQRSRLRVDTRKWYVAKLAPKRYGDLQRMELTGEDGGPIVLDDAQRAQRLAELLAKAQTRQLADEDDLVG